MAPKQASKVFIVESLRDGGRWFFEGRFSAQNQQQVRNNFTVDRIFENHGWMCRIREEGK